MSLYSPIATVAEIAKLTALSVVELRNEWAVAFGGSAPKNAQREYLLRAIAHRLQCGPCGGLPPAVIRLLRKRASGQKEASGAAGDLTRTLQLGARILREWKGSIHEVEVVDAGYRYGSQTYKSLSVIARQITGTRWSGPVFFGLKRAQAEINHGL